MEIFKLFGKIAVDNSEANRAIDETVGNVGNAEPRMTKALKPGFGGMLSLLRLLPPSR